MDVVAEFGHVEIPRRWSGVQLLLVVAVMQTLMVCVDIHFNSYKAISPFSEAINYGEESFVMDRAIALCCGQGLCVVLDRVKLLCSVDNVVLRQDTCNGLLAGISFHNSLKGTIELCEYRGG